MASALTRSLTLLALLVATSANAVLVPGGGPSKSDCYLELDVAGAQNVQKSNTVLCTDGEPCDTGACGDRVCTVSISACINQTNIAACTPPASLDSVSVKGKLSVQVPQLLGGAQCSAPVTANVTATINNKNKYIKKKSLLKLKGTAKGPRGTRPRTDKDSFTIQCVPRTVACPPPTTTTTTTTVPVTVPPTTTTTTAAGVCGDGVVNQPTEQCDGAGQPCPSSPSGAILCTTDCKLDATSCPDVQSFFFDFTNGTPSGNCGDTRDGSGMVLSTLGCGGLNIGGGESIIGEGPTPDGAVNRFDALCIGNECTVGSTSAVPPVNTPGPDCTAAGCNFGTPLPIPNGLIPQLSTCVLNTWNQPASGKLNRATGEAELNVPLNSEIWLTGALLCPKCTGTGSPATPGTGTCNGGGRDGQACTSTNSEGLTRDCPPNLNRVGTILVDLSPLRTAAVNKTATADGLFCPTQTATQEGCFGKKACRSITENGAPAGPLTPGTSSNVTLASVFCIAATNDPTVDGSANLPGPGAVSLPGSFLLTPKP